MAELTVYPKVTQYRTAAALTTRWAELGWSIPCDERILTAAEGSPMGQPIEVFGRRLGDRWCIQPMEGWDGTSDGRPSDWTGRWENFGRSGANAHLGRRSRAVPYAGGPIQSALPYTGHAARHRRTAQRRAIAATRLPLARRRIARRPSVTTPGRFSKPDDNARMERDRLSSPLLDARWASGRTTTRRLTVRRPVLNHG
jgi:hypothetical protein